MYRLSIIVVLTTLCTAIQTACTTMTHPIEQQSNLSEPIDFPDITSVELFDYISFPSIGTQTTVNEEGTVEPVPSQFGGISGMVFNEQTGKLHLVSDGSKFPSNDGANLFSFSPIANEYGIQLGETFEFARVPAFNGNGDYESVAAAPNGTLILGLEGHNKGDNQDDPALLSFNPRTSELTELVLPSEFRQMGVQGSETQDTVLGAAHNKVLEGVTTVGDKIVVSSESALVGDPTGLARIAVGDSAGNWTRYAYQLTPDNKDFSNFGLVELIPYSDDGSRFIAIERSFNSETSRNSILAYEVTITSKTTQLDDSPISSPVTTVEKELLFDLEDIADGIKPDNVEAGTIFQANGKNFLALATDNNFHAFGQEHTQLFFIELKSGGRFLRPQSWFE